jgi:protein gp37
MDGISIYGVDAKRNWLVLRIIRKFHRQSEVWLHLGLADGTVYQLVGKLHFN